MIVRDLKQDEGMRISNSNSYKEIRRGDIYYANIGENTGSIQSGIRPVMIVQNDFGNIHSPTVVVAFLSSRINKAKLPTHVIITKEECRGLTYDSFVGMEQLFTLNKYQLGSYIGNIMNDKIDKAIAISLGLKKVESKAVQVAKRKAEDIKQLDSFIEIWVSGNRSVDEIKNEVNRRKLEIKDLQYYCEVNRLNISEYYDVNYIKNGDNKNIRMVG